jgi:hypothetical protein
MTARDFNTSLTGGEIDVHILRPAYAPHVLEVANAVLIEHDPLHRQARGAARSGMNWRLRVLLAVSPGFPLVGQMG